jgi:hypothetical protein
MIDEAAPITTSHHGEAGGRTMANNNPVTAALPSLKRLHTDICTEMVLKSF